MDLSGDDVPDVTSANEAVYSRYQTAVVRFDDTITDASSLTVNVATAPYAVALQVAASLDVAQDYLGTAEARPPGGDALVKGPVPCFLTISFTAQVRQGLQAPSVPALQRAVAAFVNGLGFPGRLSASAISQVVHNA